MTTKPLQVSARAARFGIRHVPMRMPFRFGAVTLTASAQVHLFLEVEAADGRRATGLAADMLAPKWYDKDPAKDWADNLSDLVAGARAAADAALGASTPQSVYALWRQVYDACQAQAPAAGRNPLVASNGPALIERALYDALGRLLEQPYHALLRDGAAGVELADLHPELAGTTPADVLPAQPSAALHLRHTVGLVDPLRDADIAADARLDDGLPQSLEDYVRRQGIRYVKIKVGGDVDADVERLAEIAGVLDAIDGPYHISLDGNEQYNDPADLVRLLDRLESGDASLQRLADAILYLEQPLDRGIALDPGAAVDVAALSARKPMVIDESDEGLDTFRRAADMGYRGVSTKACKGMTKALANLALCRAWNAAAGEERFVVTGEDLTNVPVVALHQDLTHLAALGIEHAERNGHHYVRGLTHLPAAERDACLRDHATLYEDLGDGLAALRIRDGRIRLDSLRGSGLGVGVDIDPATTIPLETWQPADLERETGRG